jgi:hypothetical protein
MKKFPLVLILAAIMGAPCCVPFSHHDTATLLDDVESYINDHPDCALTVLKDVDDLKIRRPGQRARYYLLKAIALDKCDFDDGSLLPEMTNAAAWYAIYGKTNQRALASYYLADQQKDAGEYVEAAVTYSQAADLAETAGNWFIVGMSMRNLSDIYSRNHDPLQALDLSKRSTEAFHLAELPKHALYSCLMTARAYLNSGNFQNCLLLCDSLRKSSLFREDTGFHADVLSLAASSYIKKDPPVADSTIVLLDQIRPMFPLNSQQQAMYAWALFMKGKHHDALESIRIAYEIATDRKDSILVAPWERRITEKSGDTARQKDLLQQIYDYSEAQRQLSLRQSADKIRRQYYQQKEKALSQRVEHQRLLLTGAILFFLFITLVLVLLLRIRRIRADQRMEAELIKQAEQEKANALLSEKLSLYGSTVQNTLDFGFDILNRLTDAYYHPNRATDNVFREIIKDYVSDVSSRARLSESIETNINIIHDGVLSKLRAEVPNLKEDDIKLFSFCLFGFSYKAINTFIPESTSINTAYSRVFRLRKAIMDSGSPYVDFFLAFLKMDTPKSRYLP